MKIRLEHNGTVFEFTRQPLPEHRFRVVCRLLAAGLYVCLMLGAAALCGIAGLAAVCVVTFFGMITASMN